jgi:hypothetical protein
MLKIRSGAGVLSSRTQVDVAVMEFYVNNHFTPIVPIYIGETQRFVIGVNNGDKYSFRVNNSTRGKILCAAGVDGCSLLEQAPLSDRSTGMIIAESRYYDFRGFRLDSERVGELVANTNQEQTIGVQTSGSNGKTGSIGIIVTQEKQQQRVAYRGGYSKGIDEDNFQESYSRGGERSIGTSIGRDLPDSVREAEFNKDHDTVIQGWFNLVDARFLDEIQRTMTSLPLGYPSKPTGYQAYQMRD